VALAGEQASRTLERQDVRGIGDDLGRARGGDGPVLRRGRDDGARPERRERREEEGLEAIGDLERSGIEARGHPLVERAWNDEGVTRELGEEIARPPPCALPARDLEEDGEGLARLAAGEGLDERFVFG
jgi:hypothetical protein